MNRGWYLVLPVFAFAVFKGLKSWRWRSGAISIVCFVTYLYGPVGIAVAVMITVAIAVKGSLSQITGREDIPIMDGLAAIHAKPLLKSASSATGPESGALKTFYSRDRKRRVCIFKTGSTYGFGEEKFNDDPLENCWIPLKVDSGAICDSEQTAIKEALGRVPWLKEVIGELDA